MNKWGRFKYVYNQDEKLRLRKTETNLVNLFSIVLAAALLIVNVNFIEKILMNMIKSQSMLIIF